MQVHARTPLELVSTNLSDLISLPDPEAAEALSTRMAALDQIHRIHERSYSERGIIAREFEVRHLWKYLEDPETGQSFPHLTAWLSSGFLGCRRVSFEAKADMLLLQDIPADKLIDVPKGNIKLLLQLSTAVRNDPEVLEAAKNLDQDGFLQKLDKEHPNQHIEQRRALRFAPGRSGARVVEEMIAWALEHDIAGNRDEALVRAAETALDEWKLEQELREMPAETAGEPEWHLRGNAGGL
jgi:hypothetical protein